jgi:pyruvate ferredoxin oxidoreductase gamma subunit
MYRIRFHGRGGQGMKTASRILGSAFFHEGFEVQDAPRYGAERRGAPIFAYVRAARTKINERGVIQHPDLVVVADESLISVPAAGVLAGVDSNTVVLIDSRESADTWRHRLNLEGPIYVISASAASVTGTACAAAAARLVGVVSWNSLSRAMGEELSFLSAAEREANREAAKQAFEDLSESAASVAEGKSVAANQYRQSDWIDFPFEEARLSAPTIHGAATSVQIKTGLWRTMRPVIDFDRCNRCWWICSTFCPDGAIGVTDEGAPHIDYDHCKGCLVCVAVCPRHAIEAIPEVGAQSSPRESVR